jgi:hypothetical protein
LLLDVLRNGRGVNGCPVMGSTDVCLSLNCSFSNVLPEGTRGPGDHVRDLARDEQVSAAVVAHVEDQVVDARGAHLLDGRDQLLLCRPDVIVEQQIPDLRRRSS